MNGPAVKEKQDDEDGNCCWDKRASNEMRNSAFAGQL
jgi:hypothetical protein